MAEVQPSVHDAFTVASVSQSDISNCPFDASRHDEPNARLARVERAFNTEFRPVQATARRIAIAPGRVNLIGEHIDYEGYSVLPMAIAQSIAVVIAPSPSPPSTDRTLRITNTNPAFATATITVPTTSTSGDALFQSLTASLDASTAWVRYVLCGYMAILEYAPSVVTHAIALDLLVDGTIPTACGLSSSSALVVASALAFASSLCTLNAFPTRTQLVERCRYAEHYVGTAGGGMDQAVSCLATQNAALFVTFEPTLQVQAVRFPGPFQRGQAVFMVVNSGVQAQKAQDAATRFNKRVIECALATKLLGKRLGIVGWEKMTKLRELEVVLDESLPLLKYIETICDQDEFTRDDLETELTPTASLVSLFTGSRLENVIEQVLKTELRFRLWQRARHVWSEAERVLHFKALLATDGHETLEQLGALMFASHDSCREYYECSCPELDQIVATAKRVGAYGARLTGAGWGGCAVMLVPATRVETVRKALETDVFKGHLPPESIFESSAVAGAQLFDVGN